MDILGSGRESDLSTVLVADPGLEFWLLSCCFRRGITRCEMSFLFPTFKRTLSEKKKKKDITFQAKPITLPAQGCEMPFKYVDGILFRSFREAWDRWFWLPLLSVFVISLWFPAVLLDPDITTVPSCPFLIQWIIGCVPNWLCTVHSWEH